ncbi:MAG: Holliday junction resolvase RuvX [Acidimicrobiales bacterium]
MRVVGLDLGERRIGVAVSDRGGVLAVGHTVLERAADRSADHAAIAALVAELAGECVVVGVPLSLDGTDGPAARAERDEVADLAGALAVPIETVDERLTTVTASRALAAAGVSARGQRRVVDQVAAAVILQTWLDTKRREEALP